MNWFDRKLWIPPPLLEPKFSPHMGQIWKIMTDSDWASPKILKLIYELFRSKTLNFTPLLGPKFSPQMGRIWKIMADSDSAAPKILKNNGRFRFGSPKNIEIDIWMISIKNFEFQPPFGAPFRPPDGLDMTNNGGFRFGSPKNVEIDIWIISIENF